MRTLRRLRALAPRRARRDFDLSDATVEPDAGVPPEQVFDRSTGPFGSRRAVDLPGGFDEET
jgi:hypothetical protein